MIKLKSLLLNLNEDGDQNNNGYPDGSENVTSNVFKRIYGDEIDPEEDEESFEIYDGECSNPFTDTNMSKWEPDGWPKDPRTGLGVYTNFDIKQAGMDLDFHFDVNAQFLIHNKQLYAGAGVSEAYANDLRGNGLIGKWLENCIPDVVKFYQACPYIRDNYPNAIIKPCLQVDGDESGGYWEMLCRKNGWTLFDFN